MAAASELLAVDAALLTGASWGDIAEIGPPAPAAHRTAAVHSTASLRVGSSVNVAAPSLIDSLDNSRDGLNLMLKMSSMSGSGIDTGNGGDSRGSFTEVAGAKRKKGSLYPATSSTVTAPAAFSAPVTRGRESLVAPTRSAGFGMHTPAAANSRVSFAAALAGSDEAMRARKDAAASRKDEMLAADTGAGSVATPSPAGATANGGRGASLSRVAKKARIGPVAVAPAEAAAVCGAAVSAFSVAGFGTFKSAVLGKPASSAPVPAAAAKAAAEAMAEDAEDGFAKVQTASARRKAATGQRVVAPKLVTPVVAATAPPTAAPEAKPAAPALFWGQRLPAAASMTSPRLVADVAVENSLGFSMPSSSAPVTLAARRRGSTGAPLPTGTIGLESLLAKAAAAAAEAALAAAASSTAAPSAGAVSPATPAATTAGGSWAAHVSGAAATTDSATAASPGCDETASAGAAERQAAPEELTEHQLAQRQRQVDIGKASAGYVRYAAAVPRDARQPRSAAHPQTPDRTRVCSKRAWDGAVKAWRHALKTAWEDNSASAEKKRIVPEPVSAAAAHI